MRSLVDPCAGHRLAIGPEAAGTLRPRQPRLLPEPLQSPRKVVGEDIDHSGVVYALSRHGPSVLPGDGCAAPSPPGRLRAVRGRPAIALVQPAFTLRLNQDEVGPVAEACGVDGLHPAHMADARRYVGVSEGGSLCCPCPPRTPQRRVLALLGLCRRIRQPVTPPSPGPPISKSRL